MLKKLILIFSVFLSSFYSVFAKDFDFSSLLFFSKFYSYLANNTPVLDGIAVIFFLIGTFMIIYNLLNNVFKGDGATQAKKGAALMISVLTTGALILHNPGKSFVGFYGGIVVFYIGLIIGITLYYSFFKWVWNKYHKTNIWLAIFYVCGGFVILDLTLNSLLMNILTNLDSISDSITLNFISFIDGISQIALIFVACAFIAMLINSKKYIPSVQESYENIEKITEEERLNLKKVKALKSEIDELSGIISRQMDGVVK